MEYTVHQSAAGVARVRVAGAVTARNVRRLYDQLLGLAPMKSVKVVHLDFERVEAFDSPAAAAVACAFAELRRCGKQAELQHVSERHQLTLSFVPELPPRSRAKARAPGLERVGAWAARGKDELLQLSELMVDTLVGAARVALGRRPLRLGAIAEQCVHLGVRGAFIVGLLTFLTGLIMAFQAAHQLQRFGATIFMAEIVSLGMVREFASLMTGLILAGHSSSAIAAELGTMAVRDEIDAMRTIGIDPVSYLVLPRMVAITIVQPALTALAMLLGILGGLLVALILGLPIGAVYAGMQEALTPYDFLLGMSKSLLFAWIVGFSGCYMGLATRGGASSVGSSTTRAVVAAIFFIVVTDSVVTTLWTLLGYGER